MANGAAEEDGDDGKCEEEEGIEGREDEERRGGGRVEEREREEGVKGREGGLYGLVSICWS